ncbi:DUF1697 domain-containing protein [Svornostia abyssi]|uniref:DUF1697 domain-containing protein n=1 Tax=Svornostia abyssi TaxID=2898438 RepID=A0ABY5PMJ9_9ACTN|nr:DUF1697 domain-containing protein [Parviterribacteraceae bacterium J379]
MSQTQYVALLRGINVGGRRKVPMSALREALERAGYARVRTYIQSGNVLFASDRPAAEIEDHVEATLEQAFGFPIVVVVRSQRQFRNVVAKAPEGFGGQPDQHHSDAVFLKAPLTAKQAMRVVELRDGVDQAWPGTGVVYFQRVSAQRTKSRMSKIIATPEYWQMTIRSWATTLKLLALLDA